MPCFSRAILGVFLIGALSASTAARAELIEFTATLDGAQADACNGTGSAGTGSATLTLDTDTGIVSYEIAFSGLGSAETAAHVHGAGDKCVNVGILYGLPPGSPKIDISPALTTGQQADMLAGLHYVNIHSANFGGGEIRGQIRQVERIPAVSTWGLAAITLLLIAVAVMVMGRRRATKGA